MFWGAIAVWVLATLLLAYGYIHGRLRTDTGPSERSLVRLVMWGGAILPATVMLLLTVADVAINRSLLAPAQTKRLTVEITGHQWWWEVRYAGTDTASAVVTANEIRIPVGQPVAVRLKSADVIHSFWVPALSGKLDLIPGKTNSFWLEADRPGVYRGQCAEYCGAQHARMAFNVVAVDPRAFRAWLTQQAQPASEPASLRLQQGRNLFLTNGCGSCHTVRGTVANGEIGPDLTHVGSRLSIGAGMYPTTTATLAGWTASSQHLKPENRMPSFDTFDGDELRATATWLESLK